MGQSKLGILGNRHFEVGQSSPIGRLVPGEVEERPPLKIILVSGDVFGAAGRRLRCSDLHRHGLRDQAGDFSLYGENIDELAVDCLGPAREARPPIGEVDGDPGSVAGTLHRSG